MSFHLVLKFIYFIRETCTYVVRMPYSSTGIVIYIICNCNTTCHCAHGPLSLAAEKLHAVYCGFGVGLGVGTRDRSGAGGGGLGRVRPGST